MKTIVFIFSVFIGLAYGRSVIKVGEILPISEKTAEFFKLLEEHQSNGRSDLTRLTANANEYFDELFKYLGGYLVDNGYDPMELPNVEKSFEWKIFFITYYGELAFTRGWLNDVHTLSRNGDANIRYISKVVNVRVPMKFDTLLFNYDYKAKFMNFGPDGGMEGSLKDVDIYVDFGIDLYNLEIELQDFQIQSTGSINLKWTGNILLDWLANIFTSVTVTLFRGLIVNIVEGFVNKFIVEILDKINHDIGSILG